MQAPLRGEDESAPQLRGVGDASPRGYEGFGGVIAPTSSASSPWWPPVLVEDDERPNVVVVLVDDLGFSDTAPYGGEIPTPAIQHLADDGFLFTNFHMTPLCSPSRAALMTGANPHRAGFGFVSHVDPGYPGMSMTLPSNLPTMAEGFRENGYATMMVGKWHLTRESELHDGADKSAWPLQRGFDRYFGGMDGFTTLYHPHRLVRDNSPVTERFDDDDYLTDRLTNEAIGMIDAVRTGSSRPFFLYFAHHAVHGPLQAKPADIERHRGAYDRGWDRVRAERQERQRALGLFDVALDQPEASPEVPPWGSLSDADKALFARHMEVYAAAVNSVDDSLGQLIEHLNRIGEYERTIIVFASDNGATAEGGPRGTRSYFSQFTMSAGLPDDWIADVPRPVEDLGGPRVHGHYPTGWAHVSNTPFQRYKGSVAEGGIHSPLIVSWPAGLPRTAEDSGIRSSFTYVTDIAPTLYELSGVPRPQTLRGRPCLDIDGTSFTPSLQARSGHRSAGQHVTLLGQRAYFKDEYKLVSAAAADLDDLSSWSLFNLDLDPAERHDIASEHPDLVAELASLWRRDAWHNTVFPLPDEPTMLARRPSTESSLSRPVVLRPGSPTLERFRSARLTALRSYAVEARLDGDVGEGILFSHGDQGGGYVAWIEDSLLGLSYNAYGSLHRITAPLGRHVRNVTVEFIALPDFRRRLVMSVEGYEVAVIDSVPMLIGMAPFTGIRIGAEGGPVDWDLHLRRGAFAYDGDLREVHYIPGDKAPYNREILVEVERVSAAILD